MPVDRVAHRHVVGRDRFGNCARRTADTKKPPGDFLPSPNLSKDTIFARIEIDLERLLVSIRSLALRRRRIRECPCFLPPNGPQTIPLSLASFCWLSNNVFGAHWTFWVFKIQPREEK